MSENAMNIDINEVNARMGALAAQRETYANQVVILEGRLAVALAKIKELEEKLQKSGEEGANAEEARPG